MSRPRGTCARAAPCEPSRAPPASPLAPPASRAPRPSPPLKVIRLIKFEQRAIPGHDLRSLLSQGAKLSEAEARKVVMLADFLDKALTLDPAKRLKPAEALKHPFCDLNRK